MRLLPVKEIEGMAEALATIETDVDTKMGLMMDYIGEQTIAFLQSWTTQSAPPIRPGMPSRRRHPGYWADRTGELAASYGWEVIRNRKGHWQLNLTNDAGHAVVVEAMDGYFVLSGVTDKGGPVEAAMRRAIPIIAPDWSIQSYD